jgi:nucleotide-binding universal stress UspA family protein
MDTAVFNKILCPVDFSDSSIQGLRYAGAATQCQDARLIVLHACQFSAPLFFTKGQIDELKRQSLSCEAAARERLEELTCSTLESRPGEVEVRIIEAPAVEGILKTAKDVQSDLIVMGTHGRSGMDRLMLGSVTERILRTARIAVLAVRGGVSRTEVPPRHLLCPVNNTPLASRLLKTAVKIAECFEASLTLLHVRRAGEKYPINDLGAWVPEEERSRCHIREISRKGNVAEEVINAAMENECDLVVIGAHHKQFLDTTVLGTTTERVVRHGPCPVLVVPSEEW